MIKVMALFCFFFSTASFAATNGYSMKMELSVKGKLVSSPRIVVKVGEFASVTQDSQGEKTFIEVVATEVPGKKEPAIAMNFVVGTISASGEKTVLANPKIITLENNKAEISQGDQPGQKNLSLSVIVTRVAL
jgi:type II secretory pathway component GspD/PulD (secretin)